MHIMDKKRLSILIAALGPGEGLEGRFIWHSGCWRVNPQRISGAGSMDGYGAARRASINESA
jgi:hypothetical protein